MKSGESPSRTPRQGVVFLFLLALAAFLGYRVFYVYTVRVGACAPPELRRFEPPRSAEIRPLRVMSWNIQGHAAFVDGDHLAKVAAVIRESGAEIVGLQEVHRGTWQARFRDHARELAARTGMRTYFGRSFHAVRGDYGNAVLTKLPVTAVRVHPLPSVGEPRSLLEVRLRVEGQEIAVFITHLVAWGSLRAAIRQEQIACVTAHLEGAGVPWILMGDLNAGPAAGEIRRFATSRGVREAGPRTSTHRLMDRQLDYIFADSGFTVAGAAAIERGPSDHLAVVSTLRRDESRSAAELAE